MSKTTYIYIKTHNQTGLKYFGQTKRKDTHRYRGSGLYWKHHIKKYGYDVTTFIIRSFTNIQECEDFCIWFSKINNIVKSKKWANLVIENGLDGGNDYWKYHKMSEEHKRKISENNAKFWLGKKRGKMSDKHKQKISENSAKFWTGKNHSEESKQKMRLAKLGKTHPEESKKKMSQNSSHYWKGKKRGKMTEEHKQKLIKIHLGKPLTEEHKQKLRIKKLGKKQKKVKCPYCDKEGGICLMKRYHFDKCKLKF